MIAVQSAAGRAKIGDLMLMVLLENAPVFLEELAADPRVPWLLRLALRASARYLRSARLELAGREAP